MAQKGSLFQHRGRSDSKILSKRYDADGNVVDVESREDDEQHEKLDAIVSLLLAAGYFRARIKGLSSFDKVVGGMVWCIETCNFDVDIDLLFQENLTIGQKISLTEKIVAVLPRMKCPHRLEPHQIQGLDFIHIFPVVQWLVKRAIETREELGDTIRSFSISQFNKHFTAPQDETFDKQKAKSISTVAHVLEVYKPRRRYKRNAALQTREEMLKVHSTLLEYGKSVFVPSSKPKEDEGGDDAKNDEDKIAEERQRKLMTGMAAAEDSELRLSASVVDSIIKSADIQNLASMDNLKPSDRIERLSVEERHRRIVSSLNKQTTQKKNLSDEITGKNQELQAKLSSQQEKLNEVASRKETFENDLREFEELESGDKRSVIEKLRSLVAMNDCLKKQEQDFKAHCKEEMHRLTNDLDELKNENEGGDAEDLERSELVETQLRTDKEKLNKIRLLLAKKNREIAVIQRKLDEVPSRAELGQYQRRFIELYNQVAATHKETKQFYTLYNTLDDSRLYLAKEVKLLNSILETFTQAMSSPSSKEQFLKQFELIVEGIRVNKAKLEKKKQEEKMRRDHLSDVYLDLVEKQRLYFKTVKSLKEECRKNEILISKMKSRGE
uniref:Coiled-coil domain-containing protein 93 n=1 Tax=Strigamia maritima TaxID=126957 RepID=T1JCX3_STRMM